MAKKYLLLLLFVVILFIILLPKIVSAELLQKTIIEGESYSFNIGESKILQNGYLITLDDFDKSQNYAIFTITKGKTVIHLTIGDGNKLILTDNFDENDRIIIRADLRVYSDYIKLYNFNQYEYTYTGDLHISSNPSGAYVYLDGSKTELVTPCTISNIQTGQHKIKLIKPGYDIYNQEIDIIANKKNSISTNLFKIPTIMVLEKTELSEGNYIELEDSYSLNLIKVDGNTAKILLFKETDLIDKNDVKIGETYNYKNLISAHVNDVYSSIIDGNVVGEVIFDSIHQYNINSNMFSYVDSSGFTVSEDNVRVYLHSNKIEVKVGKEAIITLSGINAITNQPMHMQAILQIPSGMDVTKTQFAKSGGGQYTGDYIIQPGGERHINTHILANNDGVYEVKGEIIYYINENKSNKHYQRQMIQIISTSNSIVDNYSTSTPILDQTKETKTKSLSVFIIGFILILIYKRKKIINMIKQIIYNPF